MCYYADFQGIEVAFEHEDIFKENGTILVKNARNCSDCDDKRPPQKITLHELQLSEKDRTKIKKIFEKRSKEKTTSKTKRQRLPRPELN
ncbi:MAG: hypothetical protein PHE20_00425 [Patescibacteria group bacterium]|nr:hypothetical protein [Patescibacteria group bacterium]